MADAPLEVLLVELAGGKPLESPCDDWEALDLRAAEHRLQPLLHHQHSADGCIPADVRARWAAASRSSAIEALHQRRELVRIAATLAQRGIEFLALKGAWLAWHVWPEPAMRPLRDLDLYIPGEDLFAAHELLLAGGWTMEEGEDFGALTPDEWVARFKALPPLVSPGGIAVDLHARLWDEDGRTPPLPGGLFERSTSDNEHGTIRYPGPVDQLMHLSVHASFHRFDGGPLMLADFAYLIASVDFDWTEVWRRAERENWLPHLALCIAGARRWVEVASPWPEIPCEVPGEIIEGLPLLLAKPLHVRESDIAAAKAGRRDVGLRSRLGKVIARRDRFESLGAYLGWVGSEARGAVQSTLGARERVATIAALDDWLAR